MSSTYGAGLLNKIPSDSVDTEEKQIAFLKEFFKTEPCSEFYELIDDKVLHVFGDFENPTCEWVCDEEKIREVQSLRNLGGSAPYSYFSYLDGYMLFVPNDGEMYDEVSLKLPDDSEFDLVYEDMASVINFLKEENHQISKIPDEDYVEVEMSKQEYIEFHEQLIDEISQCQKAKVLYMI